MASEKIVGLRRSASSEGEVRVNCSVAADWMAWMGRDGQFYPHFSCSQLGLLFHGTQTELTAAGQILVMAMARLPWRSKSMASPLVSTLMPTLPMA